MKARFWLSVVFAAAGAALLVTAGLAGPQSSAAPQKSEARGGIIRVDSRNDWDYIDPALAYFSHSWQLESAVQLKLMGFPDQEGAAGSRMRPEAAASFPKVSSDGRTYTFTIKRGFRFSNGAPVTAANFRASFTRALNRAGGV